LAIDVVACWLVARHLHGGTDNATPA